jgi:hypothetical protein
MVEKDWKAAEKCVDSALAALKNFEIPLVEWRVHATACDLYQENSVKTAERHR